MGCFPEEIVPIYLYDYIIISILMGGATMALEDKIKNMTPEEIENIKKLYEEFKDEFGDDDKISLMPPIRLINFDLNMNSMLAGFFLGSLPYHESEEMVNKRVNHEYKSKTNDDTIICLDNGFLIEIMGIIYGMTKTWVTSHVGMEDSSYKLLLLNTVKNLQFTTWDEYKYSIDKFIDTIKAKKYPEYDNHLKRILYNIIFLTYNDIDDFKIAAIQLYENHKKKEDNNEEDRKTD